MFHSLITLSISTSRRDSRTGVHLPDPVHNGPMAHPYDKSEKFLPKDCTHILSEMYTVKELDETQWIRSAAKVATTSMGVAIKAVHPSMTIITFTNGFSLEETFKY